MPPLATTTSKLYALALELLELARAQAALAAQRQDPLVAHYGRLQRAARELAEAIEPPPDPVLEAREVGYLVLKDRNADPDWAYEVGKKALDARAQVASLMEPGAGALVPSPQPNASPLPPVGGSLPPGDGNR